MTNAGLLEDVARRLRYNAWANRLVADALVRHAGGVLRVGGVGDPLPRAYLLLAHVLCAEEVWHARIHGGTGPVQALWTAVPPEKLSPMVEARALAWEELLGVLAHEGLERIVDYVNTKGDPYRQPLVDVLGHVVNHGTHHRGEIVARLRQARVDPPITDFVHYTRTVLQRSQ